MSFLTKFGLFVEDADEVEGFLLVVLEFELPIIFNKQTKWCIY